MMRQALSRSVKACPAATRISKVVIVPRQKATATRTGSLPTRISYCNRTEFVNFRRFAKILSMDDERYRFRDNAPSSRLCLPWLLFADFIADVGISTQAGVSAIGWLLQEVRSRPR